MGISSSYSELPDKRSRAMNARINIISLATIRTPKILRSSGSLGSCLLSIVKLY